MPQVALPQKTFRMTAPAGSFVQVDFAVQGTTVALMPIGGNILLGDSAGHDVAQGFPWADGQVWVERIRQDGFMWVAGDGAAVEIAVRLHDAVETV